MIFTEPLDTGLFLGASLVWILPELARTLRLSARAARREAVPQDRSSLAVLLTLQWAGFALGMLLSWRLPAAAIGGPRSAIFLAGIVCMLLGTALRTYAVRTLGRYFTRDVAVSADQTVIRSGPYRYVRHPAYSGTLLTMLGVGLALTNWAGLAVLLGCVFVGHAYRVRTEERALLGTIGEPYAEYMQHTKRFIPFLF